MEEFVQNPRRHPRVPVRCRVSVSYRGSTWEAETEDLGPSGCQLVSPRPVAEGARLVLAISSPRLDEPLRVRGRAVWTSSSSPHRIGVGFSEDAEDDPSAWFERLVAAEPKAAAGLGRVPDRLPMDAMIFLAEPPRFVIDFTAEELTLLKAVGGGATLAEVRSRLGASWETSKHAVFALVNHRVVTLARASSVSPLRWKQVLADAEAALAADSLGRPSEKPLVFAPSPAPPPPPRPPARPPAPSSAGSIPVPDDPGPLELDDGVLASSAGGAAPSRPAAGRSPEAQSLVDRAAVEARAGRLSAAIGLLRQALAAAPGDAEIGTLLGRLAFRDRKPE